MKGKTSGPDRSVEDQSKSGDAVFTDRQLRSWASARRSVDEWRREPHGRGEGFLIARLPANANADPKSLPPILFYYRVEINGRRRTKAIGSYEPDRKGATLKDARDRRDEFEAIRRQYGCDPIEWKRDQQSAKERQLVESAKREEALQHRGTLRQLLKVYADDLETRSKKDSARVVRAAVTRNIETPFPAMLEKKAADVTQADVLAVLGDMVKRGIKRDVNKMRSYLRAAYALGLSANADPRGRAATEETDFALTANPAAGVKVIAEFNEGTSSRVLAPEEICLLWTESEKAPAAVRAAFRVALASGGQRLQQLLRLRQQDVDLADGVLRLVDPKGKGQPRQHDVPINGLARAELKQLQREDHASFVFSSDTKGKVALRGETVSAWVKAVSDDQREAARAASKPEPAAFKLADVRRTCETSLARLGIAKEVRAHLLSHGRGGVQDRHYDRHSYMDEKTAALQKWETALRDIIAPPAGPTTAAGNVIPLRRKRA